MSRTLRLVVSSLVCALYVTPVSASVYGDEGCTPGYWKNHTEDWLETPDGAVSYETTEIFGDIFGVDYDVTLLDALQGGGGNNLAGSKKILARAATAALLNAAHDGLGYPLSRYFATDDGDALFVAVQDVWDTGDRDAILDLAADLDAMNNLGCPL